MQCKSLWIKASAKCINVNVLKGQFTQKCTNPGSILGVCDFLLSDKSNRSYIKNWPGLSKPFNGDSSDQCVNGDSSDSSERFISNVINMELVQVDDVDVGVMRVPMKNAGAKETKFLL